MQYDNVKVGLGLVLLKDGMVLLAQRKRKDNGQGEYGGPGGALDPGEGLMESILRELSEECGPDVAVKNLKTICTINYRNGQSPTHWVGIGFCAEYAGGEIKLMEPNKHVTWEWHSLDDLPVPMYWPIARYIEAYKTGQNLFEL
jgi:8-oxo-dGTP diphosphatase